MDRGGRLRGKAGAMNATNTMHVFRLEMRRDELCEGWIYNGEVNLETKTSTFGEILPTDKVGFAFPDSDSEIELMESAQEAGL